MFVAVVHGVAFFVVCWRKRCVGSCCWGDCDCCSEKNKHHNTIQSIHKTMRSTFERKIMFERISMSWVGSFHRRRILKWRSLSCWISFANQSIKITPTSGWKNFYYTTLCTTSKLHILRAIAISCIVACCIAPLNKRCNGGQPCSTICDAHRILYYLTVR